MGNQESSYENSLREEYFDNEVKRLRYQAEISWNKELDFFKLIGIKPEMKILEIGGGPGYMTELIKRTFPKNSLT